MLNIEIIIAPASDNNIDIIIYKLDDSVSLFDGYKLDNKSVNNITLTIKLTIGI